MNAEKIVFAQIPVHLTYLDFNISTKEYKGRSLERKFPYCDRFFPYNPARFELIFTKHLKRQSLMQVFRHYLH
jgi:hypothetical protein